MPSERTDLGEGGILELSAELMRSMGGISGFAEKWTDVYEDEKTTASVKHQMMLFATKLFNDANELKSSVDYTKMNDEELERAALTLLEKHKGKLPWMTAHATQPS